MEQNANRNGSSNGCLLCASLNTSVRSHDADAPSVSLESVGGRDVRNGTISQGLKAKQEACIRSPAATTTSHEVTSLRRLRLIRSLLLPLSVSLT